MKMRALLLFGVIMVLLCATLMPKVAFAENLDSGNWGTCSWEISDRGVLTIHPGVGSSSDSPWDTHRDEVTSVVFSSVGGKKVILPEGSNGLFEDFVKLVSVDTSGLDTSSVKDMSMMFSWCSSLETIDVSGWDTLSVENMDGIFWGCSSLETIDVSGWDTSSVKNMDGMFESCSSLTSVDVSHWDTSSVKDVSFIFSDCSSLSAIDVSSWDTSSVEDMSCAFSYCSSLASVDVSRWDTSSVQDMYRMFSHCSSLTSLDLSRWDISSVKHMSYMFEDCSKMKRLDISGWNTSELGYVYDETMNELRSEKSSDDLYAQEVLPPWEGVYDGCDSLSWWKVGRGYTIKSDDMVPKATAANGQWWSTADGIWYSREEIASSRSGMADTYTNAESAKTSLSKATIAKIPDQAYNGGSEVKPKPTVTMGGVTLESGRDYTVSYKDNKAEGTATLTVIGKGNYTGSKSAKFTIKYMKPSWSGASRMPVGSTAAFKVTNGGYVRVKSGGKRAKSDSVVSISGKTVTAKKAGSTTIYLLDSKGKEISSKKVTAYAIHGKTWEFESSVDSKYVLDIQGKSKKDGAQMIVYERNGGDNQRYQIYRQDDGTYAIRSKRSGKWLTVEDKTNKYVQQWAWKGGSSQTWTLAVDASNRVTFVNVGTGKCFDVQGGKTKNSAKMIVWESNGGKNQKWKLNQK